MKIMVKISLFVLICVLFAYAYTPIYTPGMWRGDHGLPLIMQDDWSGSQFRPDPWPARPFFASQTTVTGDEPYYGYPIHAGVFDASSSGNLSDTILVAVALRNQLGTDFSLVSEDPSSWFVPEIYQSKANVRENPPLMDSSDFEYEFKFYAYSGWVRIDSTLTVLPDEYYAKNGNPYLIYYVWGIPKGEYRLVMKKTNDAPTQLTNCIGWGSELVWIAEAKSLADTINSYVSMWHRVTYNNLDSTRLNIANQIIYQHSKSIPGYMLKAISHLSLGDTTNGLSALDSVITYCENFSDSILPDSTQLNEFQRKWYEEQKSEAEWRKAGIEHYQSGGGFFYRL